jgi:hypothetical protein
MFEALMLLYGATKLLLSDSEMCQKKTFSPVLGFVLIE